MHYYSLIFKVVDLYMDRPGFGFGFIHCPALQLSVKQLVVKATWYCLFLIEFSSCIVPHEPFKVQETQLPILVSVVHQKNCLGIEVGDNALWGSWKMGSKVANFDKLFLCQFWSKISKILHIAPLTPQLPK